MWDLLRTTLTMNSRMPRGLSQQLWRLLTQRRYAYRKRLPYWGLMMMIKRYA
jgi:hypothetical protein